MRGQDFTKRKIKENLFFDCGPEYQQMRYAKAVNDRKIFRDIDNENYDPFELEGTGVHYNEKHLLDPMKHDLEKVLTRCLPLHFKTYVMFTTCSLSVYGILSVPRNIVMDLNNVMKVHIFQSKGSSLNLGEHTKHKTCDLLPLNLILFMHTI